MLGLEDCEIARNVFVQALFLKTMLGLSIRAAYFPLQRHTHTFRCENNQPLFLNKVPLIFNTRPLSFNTRSLLE